MQKNKLFDKESYILKNRNNTKKFIFISVFLLIVITSVGYAALSSSFLVSGEASFRVPADIRITNIQMVSTSNGGYETYNAEYYKDGTKIFATLPNNGSTITYKVTLTNRTGNQIIVNDIIEENNTNTKVTYSIDGLEKEKIYEGEEINFYITLTNPTEESQQIALILKYDIEEYIKPNAIFIFYDNSKTGMDCDTVQCALDELYAKSYSKSLLTINLNGGTFNQETTYTMNEYESIPIANPTRKGYTFDGWTIKGTGASLIDGIFMMGSTNATLTANWTPITYTITYNLDGGTVTGNPTSYNIETSTFMLKNPVKSGYIFLGWTGSNGTSKETSVVISKGSTGNKTYTANWVSGALSFDYTGGTQTLIVPVTGIYQVELYGASGGNGGIGLCTGGSGGAGGLGGYVKAEVKLTEGEAYTVYVGSAGSNGSYGARGGAAGFADGAKGIDSSDSGVSGSGGGGGGSTGIQLGDVVYLRANGGGGGGGGADGGFYRYSNGTTTCGGCNDRNAGAAGGRGGTGGGGAVGGNGAANVCNATGSSGSDGTYYVNTTYSTLIEGTNGKRSGNGQVIINYLRS